MTNKLFYGDNLTVLREHVHDESVDLVYLDPPFNSAASYNVLFRSPSGEQSQAQIEAFEDTWHWNEAAELAFSEVEANRANSQPATMLRAIRSTLGENDMMAYLAMMAVRLIELHRVLKPMGSLYLHCDPTREMTKEAASAGFYETGGKRFPKIQMLTIAQIFDGRKPEVPFGHVEGFKKAPKEKPSGSQGALF